MNECSGMFMEDLLEDPVTPGVCHSDFFESQNTNLMKRKKRWINEVDGFFSHSIG
jgi:hypothetical protein